MKAMKITVIAVLCMLAICWVRGSSWIEPLPQILPFCSGESDAGEFALVAMLGLFVWGLFRLKHRDAEEDDDAS